jgi:hypothetical protein
MNSLIFALLPSNPSARTSLALLLMAANFSACVHSSRYRSRAPYLAHPRRIRRSYDGSSIPLLSLIYRSSIAHLGCSWLFFFLLFLSTSLGRSSWLIYRSSIAHLRGHRLVGVQPLSSTDGLWLVALCR